MQKGIGPQLWPTIHRRAVLITASLGSLPDPFLPERNADAGETSEEPVEAGDAGVLASTALP